MQKDKSFPFKIFIFSLLPLAKEWNKVVLGLLILYNYYTNWALNIMLLLTCFHACCENMILSARYRSIHWQLRWFACLFRDIRGPDRDYVTDNQQVWTCRHLLSYECVGLTLIDAQKMRLDKSSIAFQSGRNNICVASSPNKGWVSFLHSPWTQLLSCFKWKYSMAHYCAFWCK